MMGKISLLLDENITPEATKYFETLGYECTHIQDLGKKGMTDEEVLDLAVEKKACLCTNNGKDFVIQVPPYPFRIKRHEGLFWNKYKAGWTRKVNQDICKAIIDYIVLKSTTGVKNHIVNVKEEQGIFICITKFPES
ncbi:DUF5615 family PIN-like protein [Listeria seeligeri]|uniref:DUF5615 family PIN-like protein n=1 Tax=Listeria seeligeri TaxID=1640 RepID=UPI00162766E4|nr:DUF5615 family PIN-like protein [Listeria seeligeri]MBC1989955.1 DUF5615 family PIN-like protein [Listeria seeligeri]MBF2347463.1 DUF5615 family PIN-like protein [Listeria seeligeri]MBF2374935.1 DUF5615 family PIN-like protein [Listeria seeligeri]MBF2421412.1 DUF5615 family PIN-like protein [Listeria seeligeri]MBF2476952.1 DUF5615 family PIN-like protein [Listeria seeligeri]